MLYICYTVVERLGLDRCSVLTRLTRVYRHAGMELVFFFEVRHLAALAKFRKSGNLWLKGVSLKNGDAYFV